MFEVLVSRSPREFRTVGAFGWSAGPLAWVKQWFPHVSCTAVANRFGLKGPATSHSTACASSTIDFLAAYRSILDGRCDLALTGGSEIIHPLFAAGFHNMRALAEQHGARLPQEPGEAKIQVL